jgi:hypothetical protein
VRAPRTPATNDRHNRHPTALHGKGQASRVLQSAFPPLELLLPKAIHANSYHSLLQEPKRLEAPRKAPTLLFVVPIRAPSAQRPSLLELAPVPAGATANRARVAGSTRSRAHRALVGADRV